METNSPQRSNADAAGKQSDQQEYRVLSAEGLELRATSDGPGTLTGYAAKFDKDSVDLGWFIERIRPGAFADALKTSDVRGLVNHDANMLLGRTSAGTLRLEENAIGLRFDLDLPDTQPGRDIAESVKRGDITGCSFAFTTKEDDWQYTDDGPDRREIIEVKELFDVGPVTYPAYPDTTVAARSLVERCKQAREEVIEPEHEEQKELTPLEAIQAQRKQERLIARLERIENRLTQAVATDSGEA